MFSLQRVIKGEPAMPTECIPDLFGFEEVKSKRVIAAFDGGAISSDAGALLLGLADRAIGLVDRLAACFTDGRNPVFVEHELRTLLMQRIFGIALGYEEAILPQFRTMF